MKCLVALSIVIAVCAANVIKDPVTGYKEGDRYFYFVGDDDRIPQLIDAFDPVDQPFIEQYAQNPNSIGYWLFTRHNRLAPQILQFGDVESILSSNFASTKKTVFLAHGWNGSGNSSMNTVLTEAFLRSNDVNIIVVDWNEVANKNYLTAKAGVPEVGRTVGQFVNWLVEYNLTSYQRVHLVGFSLGGHLVGNAGRETGGKVERITSLDPAGPLWLLDRQRIVPSDGVYVEVIHTNTAFYGFTDACGDTDFYPNGGIHMPGCDDNSCSHHRAVQYMASSLKYNHLQGNECDSLWSMWLNRCSGEQEYLGNGQLSPKRPGIYRVNTGDDYPY